MKDELLKTLTLAAAATAASPQMAWAQSHDPARPNILCVVCEDISSYLGCYGDKVAKSPNLDKFATQAVRFSNMHTPNGVSSPSRFALITGCYPSTYGGNYMRASYYDYDVVLPAHMKAYTEHMREAGYFCTNNSKTDYQIGVTPAQWDENGREASWKHCPEGKPFLSIYNIFTTHESQLWARKDPLEVQPEDIDMSKFPYFPDVPEVRNDLARMYTNIAIMDRESQALFDQIEEAGLSDNTVIIWYSDNGGPIPRGKRSIYDTGTRVPFMIKFPDGYRAGEVEDRLCLFQDIPATILSLAGVKVPEYMEGKPFFGAQNTPEREYIFAARDRYDGVSDHSASARDHRYHYVRNYKPEQCNYLDNDFRLGLPMMKKMLEMRDKGELNEQQMLYFKAPRPVEEFYDLANDPYELHNLADDPMYKHELERLKEAFDGWNTTINAPWNTKTEEQWIAEFKPNGQRQVCEAPVITRTAEGYVVTCSTPGVGIEWKYTDGKKEKKVEPVDTSNQWAALTGGLGDKSKGWNYYTQPIPVVKGKTLVVMACRAGFTDSPEVSVKMK